MVGAPRTQTAHLVRVSDDVERAWEPALGHVRHVEEGAERRERHLARVVRVGLLGRVRAVQQSAANREMS